jgi:hypothetical protein
MASTVNIDFNANLARFSSAIDKATNDLNKFQTNAGRISGNINKAFSTIGVGISVAGVASFVKSAVDAADRLNDLNKSTGIAVEQLAGLDLAARQSGGDLDSVAQSINKLSVNIGQNAEKFKALGITAKEPLEAFKQLADIYVSIEDPQKRAAFAAEALGKSWQGAAPLLAEGGKRIQEMVDRGAELSGITQKNVEQADKFNDQLEEMSTLSSSIGLSFGKLVVPVLNDYFEILSKSATETDYFAGVLERFKLAAINLAPGFALIARAFSDETGPAVSGKIKKAADETNKNVDAFIASAKPAATKRTSSGGSTVDRDAQESKRFVESLTKEASTLGLTSVALKEYEAAHLKLTPAQRAIVADAIKKIEAFDEEQQRLEKLTEAYENHQRVMDDFNDRETQAFEEQGAFDAETVKSLSDFVDQLERARDPSLELLDNIGKIQSAVSLGIISVEQGDEYVKYLEDAAKKTEETTDDITLFWKKAAENMQDAMSDFFFDAMQGNLSDLATSFKSTIDRMVANMLAARAATSLFGEEFTSGKSDVVGGFAGKLFGGIGDFFGGLFNADGNAFDQSGVMAFANGGVVSSATPFSFGGGKLGVMGEAGPEAILPLKRGPNGQLGVQAGGGSTQIVMNIQTPNADSFRKSQPQIMAEMQRGLNRGRRVM